MRKLINLFLILLISTALFGQEKEYKSKAQEEYYKQSKFQPFKPLSKKEILTYKNPFFKFEEMVNYTPFSQSLYLTPYQDSINAIIFHPENWGTEGFPNLELEFIGKIEKSHILKYDKKDSIEAFVYTSIEFEGRYNKEPGVWVAFSKNNGKSWEYLYTGIVQQQPLYLKWYSDIPLIKSESELQIESCLSRQLSEFVMPGPRPDYEVVKDGLLLTLDLETLRKDSDHDGLTDIIETKFYTNPNKKDTDHDGIPDNLDLNPRYASKRTDKTIIFEWLLNENSSDTLINISSSLKTPPTCSVTYSTETVLIVTNCPYIQSVQPTSTRVIILSEKEYEKEKGPFHDQLNKMLVTPLFKVDDEPNTFVFLQSFNVSGGKYLVKKVNNQWKISNISSWIH